MTLSLQYNDDTGLWDMMVASHGLAPTPAGVRIFHAYPWPVSEFSHESREVMAGRLGLAQAYLDNLDTRKPSKKQRQQQQA